MQIFSGTKEKTWPCPFQEMFCRTFGCAPGEYEKEYFKRSLTRRARPLAALLAWLSPNYFREDLMVIRTLGALRDAEEFTFEIGYFNGRNLRDTRLLRRVLRVRVSERRLLKIKNQVLRHWARSTQTGGAATVPTSETKLDPGAVLASPS